MTAVIPRSTNGVDIEALYRDRQPTLVRYAAKVAGNHASGEDAVQQAFEAIIKDPGLAARKGVDPGAIVTAGTRYRALDESVQRGKQTPFGEAMDWQPDPSSLHDDEDDDAWKPCMADPEVAAKAHKALAQLSDFERAVITLYSLEGQPVSVISERLGVDKGSIYGAITRALARLRQLGVPESGAPEDIDKDVADGRLSGAVATLAHDFPGRPVKIAEAEKAIRRARGSCSTERASKAARIHNTGLQSASATAAPRAVRRGRVATAPVAASVTPTRQPTIEELAATLTKEVGQHRIGVDSAEVVLRRVHGHCSRNRASDAKNLHNGRLPEGAPPAAVRPESPDEMPDAVRTRLNESLALLARVAAGRRVTHDDTQEILRANGGARASKVVSAATRLHNETLPDSAPRYRDRPNRHVPAPPAEHKPSMATAVRKRKPSILRAAAFLRATYGATPPADLPGTGELARRHEWDGSTASYARSSYIEGLDLESPVPAALISSPVGDEINKSPILKDGNGRGPKAASVSRETDGAAPTSVAVSEAWLSWADAQVTCMFVHADETTTRHPTTFRSMPGAQREITGSLIGDGYTPDGPWIATNQGAGETAEAMRRFQPPAGGSR